MRTGTHFEARSAHEDIPYLAMPATTVTTFDSQWQAVSPEPAGVLARTIDFAYGDAGLTCLFMGEAHQIDLTQPEVPANSVRSKVRVARIILEPTFVPNRMVSLKYVLVPRTEPLNVNHLKSLVTERTE